MQNKMITSAKLVNSPILCDTFGLSRVYEVSRRLRENGLFGAASTKVTYLEAASLLYVLCASRTVSAAGKVIDIMPDIADRHGNIFIYDLAEMLKNDQLLHAASEISISQNTGLVYLTTIDKEISNLYCLPGSKEPAVNFFCTIRAEFLRAYANAIKLTNTILSN